MSTQWSGLKQVLQVLQRVRHDSMIVHNDTTMANLLLLPALLALGAQASGLSSSTGGSDSTLSK